MITHLKTQHKEVPLIENETPSASGDAPIPATASASNEPRKRGGTYAKLFELCPKRRREELFQSTIPDWVEAKTMMKFENPRSLRLHKSIFEMLVMDLVPFTEVAKPGFLRHHYVAIPNFNVASPTYYRSQLEPMYDGIKSKLMDKLKKDAPPTVSIGLDGWSQHHHGYMGLNLHYINGR